MPSKKREKMHADDDRWTRWLVFSLGAVIAVTAGYIVFEWAGAGTVAGLLLVVALFALGTSRKQR